MTGCGMKHIFESMTLAGNHLDYRPDLDGLRAYAVLPVLFFHAGIGVFAGGFVGVDIFFVLSGFFMAKIILRDLDRGEFSFLDFYLRRMRRIFPALFAMIAVTSAVASFLFMPQEFEYFAASVEAAVLFVANILFRQESGYFDIASDMKPLLHTWSLSVEEQFYVVFPLALYLTHKFARPRLVPLIVAFIVISFGASLWAVHYRPEKAFYLLHFRVWELLVGALVAAVPKRRDNAAADTLLGFGGFAAILISVFVYRSEMPFPGLSALLPCLGAAALIRANSRSGPIAAILTNRPTVFIGKISYSLYLWHWPVIVFAQYLTVGSLTPELKAAVIAVSLLLAFLSWKYIEQPVRFGRLKAVSKPTVLASSAAFILVACGFAMVVQRTAGLPQRLPPEAARLYQATYDTGPFNAPKCFADSDGKGLSTDQIDRSELCDIGVPGGKPQFLLWGDSHAAAIAPALDVTAKRLGITGTFVGRASCPPLPETQFGEQAHVDRCIEHLKAVTALIERQKYPMVFLAGYWPKYVHRSELPQQGVFFDPRVAPDLHDWSQPIVTGLTAVVEKLKRQGSQPVLIMDVPEVGYTVPEALARAYMAGKSLDIAPDLAYTRARQALARKVLSDVATSSGSWIVDPMGSLCNAQGCKVMEAETVLYHDGDHLTASGARYLAPLFQRVLGANQ
jgi:peptidoglycan/LPS O-acetylase OafA/YrhL